MPTNARCATLVLGRRLVGALALPGALACSAPADPIAEPERAFVETPGGRRISFAAPKLGVSAPALAVEGQPFVIAKFDGRITPAARRTLLASGYREVAYLPYDALLLERPVGAPDRVVPGMLGFAPYTAADRISRELLPDAIAARATQPEVAVMVHVMPGHDRAAVRAAVQARGGRIAGEGDAGAFGRLAVLFPQQAAADEVRLLAERSDLFFLERIHRLGLQNSRLVGTMQSGQQGNDIAQTPIWAHGLRGESQIVAEIDTGLDANSCYFNDAALPVTNTWSSGGGYGTLTGPTHRKVVAYDFLYSCDQYPTGMNCETPTNLTQWDTQGHGTHVAGNIVGDSDMSPATYTAQDAIAPAAKIVIQDGGYAFDTCAELPGLGCPVINLEPLFEQAFVQGARAHNNSYGDNEEARPAYLQSNYTARTVDVDHFMWTHKDFLIIFAAGNYGQNNADFSMGSPATMKNGLAIGSARISTTSSPSDENISAFSSRGWSADGRIKPDLMTPGHNAAAGRNATVGDPVNCNASAGGGTSYAAPVAVGVAALVRQYFTEGFYPSGAKNAADQLTPTAALVKATMLNSAVSMTGTDNSGGPISPIPSNEQGWGRIRLDQSLVFAGGARKLLIDDHRATWAAGATTPVTYTVQGVTAGQQLKATLAWTDYPGVPDSPPSAQPNIDNPSSWNAAQLVNDIDLKVEGPSGTYLGNVFTNGTSSTGGTADRRNNVEQVLIASASAGDYTITVTPFSIVQAGQDFALVVTWGAPGAADGGTDGGDASSDASDAPDAPDGAETGAGGSDGATGSDGASDSLGTDATGGTGGSAGSGGTAGSSGAGGANDSGASADSSDSGRDASPDVGTGGAGGVGGGGSSGTGGGDGGSAGRGGIGAGGSAGRGGGSMGGSAGTGGSGGAGGSAGSVRDAGTDGSAGAARDGGATGGAAGARADAGSDDTGNGDGCSCTLARQPASSSRQLVWLLGLPLLARARRRLRRAP
jgi:subtilisin family serine protease